MKCPKFNIYKNGKLIQSVEGFSAYEILKDYYTKIVNTLTDKDRLSVIKEKKRKGEH